MAVHRGDGGFSSGDLLGVFYLFGMKELGELIQENGFTIKFGLEQQGHIETIEKELKRWNDNFEKEYPKSGANMAYSVHVWESIGKKIGWHPFTAALHYFEYLESKQQK